MIRSLILVVLACAVVWAPWMDSNPSEELMEQILAAFGPVPSVCYDSENNVLQDGLLVRWYPMGRMVHTCSGDYILWMWGDMKELGGVSKKADEIQRVQSKALTCGEVLERQEARRATSTDSELVFYTGDIAQQPDFSIFPEAEDHKTTITNALKSGPTFAGRFAVAEWGCGSNCKSSAVIDVETGLVIAYGTQTEYGIDYSLESTLLVTNPLNTLPPLPENGYETENLALSIARVPREYFRLTSDALSGTQYLVRQCIESSAAGYIEVEDDRLGIINTTQE